jgi:DNA-3-methyladenine glycosylase II
LAASIRFLEGFAPAAAHGESPADLEMAFCVDGFWDPVAVRVQEDTGAVHGKVHGGESLSPAVIAAAVAQVERILSLDIDGRGFPDIARHDPVVAQLQSRYPGLRPVCFWSPYEAAAWAVIGQRIRIVQAAAIKAQITAEHGEIIDVGGRMVRAFPYPAKLAQLSMINGLSETKLQRLRGVAEAALGGTLGAARLRSLPRPLAFEKLIAIPGIGRFSAELILLRGAGDPDYTPTAEPRLARAMTTAYDMKAPPSATDIAEISEAWKPYRTWVTLLLRTMLEDETHEIAGQAVPRTPGP